MKINDELERLILLQQSSESTPAGQTQIDPEKFADLLGEQLQEQISGGVATGGALDALSTSSQMLNASLLGLSAVDPMVRQAQSQAVGSIFNNYNEMLGVLDDYGTQLSGSETDLRSAWSALESLSVQVSGLRSALEGLQESPEGLDSLVSEMEVLIATEQFKFNRGDYF